MSPAALRQRLSPGALLRRLLAARGSIQTPVATEWRASLTAIDETRRRTALLMNDAAALQIQICVAAARRLPGEMAEAGVLTGGSARLICEAKGQTPLHLFDVFETLQEDGTVDAEAAVVRAHFGAVHGQRIQVERLLAGYPAVMLHPGLFPRSAAGLEALRFSFVHLDLDLPKGTREGLAFFYPRLSPGGMLIGDDYGDPGVRGVFADYFADRPDTVIALPWGQVLIVKQGEG
ncbi:TylF/MycF/NovP-related O-methyltransferase [Caulobacter sp. BK020]|uniref:TylF/MycF/NovP-related O-methyltransferase n=1 Tax=Caulobacter sp. BK020 TaxID=2512117 RepID=UPI00104A94F6|nr:TylF/MycF/NovP-related O-methyltransferase [Caulobacter sp. BK020]TCS14905.1 macrocin-O-methyltransferase TylF [Caulobacter sp. BK020]